MQNPPVTDRNRTVLFIVFLCLGILALLARAAYLIVTGLSAPHSGAPAAVASAAGDDLSGSILNAAGMLFCVLALLPAIYYNLRRLRGGELKPVDIPRVKVWQLIVLAGIWLAVIAFGSVFTAFFKLGWIAVIPSFPFGLAIPIAGLAWVAAGGVSSGSLRRLWSVFGLSLVGSTGLALLGEYLVIGLAAVGVGVVLISNPEWRTVIDQLRQQVGNASDIQSAMTALAPYLTNPLVFLAILLFVAGIGPVIEETVKPLAVWLLGKKLRAPAEGFALGALCGAGFALLEGLMAASGFSQAWGLGMAGRAASSLMHITASAIMGWGIASARLEKRWGRLAMAYPMALAIHATWNGSTLLAVYGGLRLSLQANPPDLVAGAIVLAGVGLLFTLFVLALVLLPLINYNLRTTPVAAPPAPGKSDV